MAWADVIALLLRLLSSTGKTTYWQATVVSAVAFYWRQPCHGLAIYNAIHSVNYLMTAYISGCLFLPTILYGSIYWHYIPYFLNTGG